MKLGLALAAAYLVGAIPFGYVLTRVFTGKDVRAVGSGNIGATNVLRAGGKKLGVATLILDMMKGLLPVKASMFLFSEPWVPGAVGLAAFLGHCFPVYLRFKGGKGVATGFGVVTALSPVVSAIAAAAFIAVVWSTGWVSLGSMTAAALVPLALYLAGAPPAVDLAMLAVAALVVARHHENIRRLLAGAEPKFGKTSPGETP